MTAKKRLRPDARIFLQISIEEHIIIQTLLPVYRNKTASFADKKARRDWPFPYKFPAPCGWPPKISPASPHPSHPCGFVHPPRDQPSARQKTSAARVFPFSYTAQFSASVYSKAAAYPAQTATNVINMAIIQETNRFILFLRF